MKSSRIVDARGAVSVAALLGLLWACGSSTASSGQLAPQGGAAGAVSERAGGGGRSSGTAGRGGANGGAPAEGGASNSAGTNSTAGEAGEPLADAGQGGAGDSSQGGALASNAGAAGDTSAPGAFTLTLGAETAVASYAQRLAQGFHFGFVDGVMGAVNTAGNYVYFGSAQALDDGRCPSVTSAPLAAGKPGKPGVQSAFKLMGTEVSLGSDCTPLIEPAPTTTDTRFDRDYTGGGPVMRLSSADGKKTGIFMVYHAEYHWGPTCAGGAPCFYGSLGLALSTDGGASFERLGQIIQPHRTRQDIVTENDHSLSIGAGPFVEGDEDGRPIRDHSAADPAHTYLYVFFPDEDFDQSPPLVGQCAVRACLAVARALESDVTTAAFAGDSASIPTLFHKYYQGAWQALGTSNVPDNSQPAGHYTPVMPQPGNSPSVIYDAYLGRYLMAHMQTPDGPGTPSQIVLRVGESVTSWSDIVATLDPNDAQLVATEAPGPGAGDTQEVRYPSLIGENGNPSVGGKAPRLYYSKEPLAGAWSVTTFELRPLKIVAD